MKFLEHKKPRTSHQTVKFHHSAVCVDGSVPPLGLSTPQGPSTPTGRRPRAVTGGAARHWPRGGAEPAVTAGSDAPQPPGVGVTTDTRPADQAADVVLLLRV